MQVLAESSPYMESFFIWTVPVIRDKIARIAVTIFRHGGSLTPENLASLMAAYFFVKFRKFLVRNSVIYDIIRLYHLS